MAYLAIGTWTIVGSKSINNKPRKTRRTQGNHEAMHEIPENNFFARTVGEIRNPHPTPNHEMESVRANDNSGIGQRIDNTRSATCPVCGRTFTTYGGRRLHERKSHATEYFNEEVDALNNKSKKRWTDEEMYLIAQRDAALEHTGMLNIDRMDILCEEFKRSADSLKKRRNLPEYKALVKAALEKLRDSPIVQLYVRRELHTIPEVQIEPLYDVSTVNKLLHNTVKKRVALLWTTEEETLLAHKEAALIKEGIVGAEMNRILSEGSNRSQESIRKRRCLAAYKSLVQAKLQELNKEPIQEEFNRDEEEIQGVYVPDTPLTQEEPINELVSQVVGRSGWSVWSVGQSVGQSVIQSVSDQPNESHETQDPIPELTEDDHAEINRQTMFKHWFTVAGESQLGNLWDPSSRMGIKENHVEIDKYTDLFMEVEGLIKEERPKNVERKKTAPPKGGRNIQRNYLRALTQKKFEKDPSGCIRGILNNTLVTESGVENEVLREYWKEVFNKTPVCEVFESKTKHPTLYGLSEPITHKEVEEGLKALKTKSAAGVDGVTCADLRKIKVGKIVTLFRVYQACSYTPPKLRLGSVIRYRNQHYLNITDL